MVEMSEVYSPGRTELTSATRCIGQQIGTPGAEAEPQGDGSYTTGTGPHLGILQLPKESTWTPPDTFDAGRHIASPPSRSHTGPEGR